MRRLRLPAIVALLRHHGGVASVHVHPVTAFNRATGAYDRVGWANTLICTDGYKRRLTLAEDRALRSWGPVMEDGPA